MAAKVRWLGGVAGLMALVVLFSAPLGVVQAALVWQTETVDAENLTGSFSSLALDAAGRPHISYHDSTTQELRYAYQNGAGWVFDTVDSEGKVGWHTSLKLDSQDQPHISYFDPDQGHLKYAHHDGTGWQTVTLDADPDVGWDTSLALDSQDQPHISYYDKANGNLKYAHHDGSDWQFQIVDATGNTGWFTSLALDSQGQPHISYYGLINNDLKYAAFDGTDWQTETIETVGALGWATSLALDSQDQPHISYAYFNARDLKYAHAELNQLPTIDAGGPYSGDEGSPINLDGAVSDPENDELTTTWSYTIDAADPGTTCTFGDPSQVETTFTCTDDGTFTLTLEASDGLNPIVTDSATVTVANVAPTITDITATVTGTQATVTVTATDPAGANDPLSYAFDCNNDGGFEVDAGATPTTTCPLNVQQEGSFQFGVQATDDDGGITTDTITVTVATELCANDYTGVLRYSADCQSHETAIALSDDGPVTVCASIHNGLLRAPATGVCTSHETSYALPEDGPLNVCVSIYTKTLREVNSLSQCAGHEFGQVITASEIGTTPPRSR